MSSIQFILLIAWGIRIIGNVASYIQLWWVKEYRWDRMLIHLKTASGRRIVFPQWKRPPLRIKTIVLILATLGVLTIIFTALPYSRIVNMLLADIISFPMTLILVLLMQLPTNIYHSLLIKRAIQKLRSHTLMLVIGITGSYGKTSVKDYLATILGSKFKVLITDASKNSPIGIAESILQKLNADQEIFVVEMGAYKRGEIRDMARMVQPQIGIITAINSQHLDLFGTIENTMNAKYELIAGLVGKKIGIFNADDVRVKKMGNRARSEGKEVWWWSTGKSNINNQMSNKNFLAKNVQTTLDGIEFDCMLGNEKAKVSASVLGEHQAGNILAAIAGAVASGMSFADAVRGASRVQPSAGVMQKKEGINGSIFIDDTFNNNPDAARAALAFLQNHDGKKFLVFQPMIELGDAASKSHYEVGKYAGSICDKIFLTNDNWKNDFISGVRASNTSIVVDVISSPQQTASLIRSTVDKHDLVLFKGKESARVLNILMH